MILEGWGEISGFQLQRGSWYTSVVLIISQVREMFTIIWGSYIGFKKT